MDELGTLRRVALECSTQSLMGHSHGEKDKNAVKNVGSSGLVHEVSGKTKLL